MIIYTDVHITNLPITITLVKLNEDQKENMYFLLTLRRFY